MTVSASPRRTIPIDRSPVKKPDARGREERDNANHNVIHQFGISASSVPDLEERGSAPTLWRDRRSGFPPYLPAKVTSGLSGPGRRQSDGHGLHAREPIKRWTMAFAQTEGQ